MLSFLWWLITLPFALISFVAKLLLWPAFLLLAVCWLAGRLAKR